jgi:hypothetical protein
MTRLIFIFALFLLTAFRCSKEEDMGPIEYPAYISSVYAPATGSVGEPITLDITFTVVNSCGQFGRLATEAHGDTHLIMVYPKYEGQVCAQALKDLITSYTFTPTRKGIYTFQFWQAPEQYLVKAIEIQ